MKSKLITEWLKNHWGQCLLVIVLLIIIGVNFKPGFSILGNDNFSPEVNSQITLQRLLSSPAWREYRVLGLPSDSEQSDIFRVLLFWIFSKFLPVWIISQGYLFITFFIAIISAGFLATGFHQNVISQKRKQLLFLSGGLLYLSTLLTSWIYFYPIHLFIASFAFLPLTLWRLREFFQKPSTNNAIILFLCSLMLSTVALTATVFFVCGVIILLFLVIFWAINYRQLLLKKSIIIGILSLFLTLGIQSFWFLPFVTYVKTNSASLQSSQINREITATSIENEIKNNNAINSSRYYFSWTETKKNNLEYEFPYRNWYRNSPLANFLSLIPVALAGMGLVYAIFNKNIYLLAIWFMAFTGWFFIKGVNPPGGYLFELLQEKIPFFAQVFRWQSSKFWPLLAICLPILGANGVVFITDILKRKNKYLSAIFISLVIIASLLFIHPYFKGNLVNKNVFNKIPQQYYELASYLQKNDKDSRIYVAPEANTLYFRNYCWGFWGSVILNYLIPNPIVEKALIVGSYENEQAFDTLKNSYYSEDQLSFAKSLTIYNTPLILSDKNACKGNVGYNYDWDIHRKMTEENPYLTRIWEKDNLALYKTNNRLISPPFEEMTVSDNHNWGALNTIISNSPTDTNYFSSTQKTGVIFPFAQKFVKEYFDGNELIASSLYNQKPDIYSWVITPDQIINSPVKLEFSRLNNRINITPAMYYFSINDKKYLSSVPLSFGKIIDSPAFLSLAGQVFSVSQNPITVDTKYKQIYQQNILKKWLPKFTTINITNNPEFSVEKDTIIQLRIAIMAENPLNGTLCFWSNNQQRCLNRNNYLSITKGAYRHQLLIPQVIEKGDRVRVFVNFNSQKDINLELDLYQESKSINLSHGSIFENPQIYLLNLKRNDNFDLHIPLSVGQNSFILKPESNFFPESNIVPFEIGKGKGEIKLLPSNSLEFSATETNTSLYPHLDKIDPRDGYALIAFSGENLQGIPAYITLRNYKQEFDLYKRIINSKSKETVFDLLFLPQEIRTYILEFFSTGIGPRASINRLDNFTFQNIPRQWVEVKLVPVSYQNSKPNIIKNNNAISPYWVLTKPKGEPIRINGWQQGWIVNNEGKNIKPQIIFWPNLLSYFGYAVVIITALVLLVRRIKEIPYRKLPENEGPQKV